MLHVLQLLDTHSVKTMRLVNQRCVARMQPCPALLSDSHLASCCSGLGNILIRWNACNVQMGRFGARLDQAGGMRKYGILQACGPLPCTAGDWHLLRQVEDVEGRQESVAAAGKGPLLRFYSACTSTCVCIPGQHACGAWWFRAGRMQTQIAVAYGREGTKTARITDP